MVEVARSEIELSFPLGESVQTVNIQCLRVEPSVVKDVSVMNKRDRGVIEKLT